MSKYRIVHYCDAILFGVEEFVNNVWQYAHVMRPREPKMMDHRDMTFEKLEDARKAVERLKDRDARLAKKEADRIIE